MLESEYTTEKCIIYNTLIRNYIVANIFDLPNTFHYLRKILPFMNELEREYNDKAESYYKHPRNEMLAFLPNSLTTMLDVGCSSGGFGILVKQLHNCEVWGIEPDQKAAEVASNVLDKVYNSFFDDRVDLGGKRFDVIVFNDVLEHFINPFETLHYCKQFLSPGGLVVSSIPNFRFFDAIYHVLVQKDFHYVGSGIFDKTHLRFFTKMSAERMFSEAGFIIKRIEGINSIKDFNLKGYRNFQILNTILMGKIADMEFQQFAIVASL